MSDMPAVKIVDTEDDADISIPRDVYTRLSGYAEHLSGELGFTVSPANTIGFLIKRVTVDFPAFETQWRKQFAELEHRLAVARGVSDTPLPVLQQTFENDFAAIVNVPEGMTVADINVTRAYAHGSQKINAIKHVREKTRLGLKEAKDWVEANFK